MFIFFFTLIGFVLGSFWGVYYCLMTCYKRMNKRITHFGSVSEFIDFILER